MEQKIERMKALVAMLNDAAKAYYQEDREIMSNYEYDELYDELLALEQETGTVLSNSPSVHVGYEVLSELPKEAHESPMLSLDKTKDVAALRSWLGEHKGSLSWKLDGLTIVLTYEGGVLQKAVTRGNGEIGEVITNNARVFKNLPHKIPYDKELILRGEAVIKYSDFEKINAQIEDVDARYKNPRNLCSGSVRQLNNEITAKRNVHFFAFTLVRADGVDFHNSRIAQMEWLKALGFDIVEYKEVTQDTIEDAVGYFAANIEKNDVPSDGLVLTYDDIEYSRSLGTTAKFPRDSMAFKWADETAQTRLLQIEWSASRTGLINPVAIFEPVQLEGTTVSRASVHNISIIESLKLGIGDTIEVYKANMIIPQIARNLTESGNLPVPGECPVCGGQTRIQQMNDTKSLYCTNPDCPAKKIKAYTLFVSRDAFNIEGLSEATLEKFVQKGFIHEFADIFRLERFKETITQMDGFGEKSYGNLQDSIEKARKIILPKFIYSLGIPGVGLANARLICKAFSQDLDRVRSASSEALTDIPGIGQVIADSVVEFFNNKKNQAVVDHLLEEVVVEKEAEEENNASVSGKTFVITGSLNHFANRSALKTLIESKGGKVAGSVSSKTDYLINNDSLSTSSKNKKARELNIPILTEEQFLEILGQ
ncbi:MAG TPA: NAD-dependent DNA ligase LigA [Candidatus Scybalocola faecigallinarum]|uniref:DNA ligase n=1 Tax=Candidatus Scybalocola faecigallinarum TaxID=2840941 RepID=A0A9D1JRV0_9FIRM|nr:NAD-dependent DNA ligase LigA [Candidatus Scybalocola faecigallinarum]